MNILGISAFYHDSAAALICGDRIVAAAQEERFSRKKHDSKFPVSAIQYCLAAGSLDANKLDAVVFYDKPFLKFDRILETYLAEAPRGFRSFSTGFPIWIKEKLFQKRELLREMEALFPDINWRERLLFSEHHLSHAASAFYPSPFYRAAIITMDGVGEWATTAVSLGFGNDIRIIKEINFPHSLGLLYSAFTYHAGFKVNSGEYKLMGLAPYGVPTYVDKIRDYLIDIKDDGSFRLNLEYFNFTAGLTMTSKKFDALMGGPARQPESDLSQREMDMAASVQVVTEEVIARMASSIRRETGETNLCLAGGVALNCVANGRLARSNLFDRIWVQPAAGDAGGALGAALAASNMWAGIPRRLENPDSMQGCFLGPEYDQTEIEKQLSDCGAIYTVLGDEEIADSCAAALADGLAVGWFQGRMEFGPRALGARSILADPRSPDMQKKLNLKIKYRESFRPFAPAVLRNDVSEWFDLDADSPYMLLVADVAKDKLNTISTGQADLPGLKKLGVPRSKIPAVTHVDNTARVQTVTKLTNPKFYELLLRFKAITGCPVLVNTSFNIRGEPIVESPRDAFRCFMGTELDVMVVGRCLIHKKYQRTHLKEDYSRHFERD